MFTSSPDLSEVLHTFTADSPLLFTPASVTGLGVLKNTRDVLI